MRRFVLAGLVAALGLMTPAQPARADLVTDWSNQADALGGGLANWYSAAIMHMAMHDAINAANPTYQRWVPPGPGEPPGDRASPAAAAIAAAATVLRTLHPDQAALIADFFQLQLADTPAGPARDAGVALGRAVAATVLASRRNDGFASVHSFPSSTVDGRWRPTPPSNATSGTSRVRPFLFAARNDNLGPPPPAPGSPRYLADVAEVRRVGAKVAPDRTAAQSEAALFWAFQSTQRGVMNFLADRLEAEPLPGGLAEHAWRMSQAATAMADAAILAWAEKERYEFWRPITAIRSGKFGVAPDPQWQSFIETPPHPEYPSGHAADCFTGAGLIRAVIGPHSGPFTYVAQSSLPTEAHQAVAERRAAATPPRPTPPRPFTFRSVSREFPSVEAAAIECADSRVWAGVHFRSANEESKRLAQGIIERARDAVPLLAPPQP